MKKIGISILLAIFTVTMAASLLVGGFIYSNSSRYIKTETNDKLSFMSRAYSQSFNLRLLTVENVLDTACSYVLNTFDTEELKAGGYISRYESTADSFFRDLAEKHTDFEAIYLTFNAELSGEFREIWYLRIEEDDPPKRVDSELYAAYTDTPATGDDIYPNMSLFTPDNSAMAYYFEAVKIGEQAWYEPTEEVGFPLTIISCTRPVYKDELLIGVIGIDINIESLKQTIRELDVMKDGYAFLLNSDLNVIIHPEYPEYTLLADAEPATYELLKPYLTRTERHATEIYSGNERIFACSRLPNGWILVLSIGTDEVFRPLKDLLFSFIIIAALISGFSFLAALAFSNRISNPVRLAAEQLEHIRVGELDLQLPEDMLNRKDEIGEVVKSVDAVTELIREEVEKNRQKDAILTYQTRLARTGEMIAHIAHQWRQPLNSLNLIISNTEEDFHEAVEADQELKKTLDKCRRIIGQMSQTIDDFRYFLRPGSRKEYFSVETSLIFVLEMIQDSLKSHKIKTVLSFSPMPEIYGPANEFTQVVLNILYNARDALKEHPPGNRTISISTWTENDCAVIEIENNGPELPGSVMDNLFKPYFTTKEDDKGTGIGLYMSRLILETHFGGEISLHSTGDGVVCIIKLPQKTEDEDIDDR